MMSGKMMSGNMLWLIAAGGLSLATAGQNVPRTAPIPSDPLEIVSDQAGAVRTHPNRAAVLGLLGRAREGYALRSAGRGYDLKARFTVESGGQTAYDGDLGNGRRIRSQTRLALDS